MHMKDKRVGTKHSWLQEKNRWNKGWRNGKFGYTTIQCIQIQYRKKEEILQSLTIHYNYILYFVECTVLLVVDVFMFVLLGVQAGKFGTIANQHTMKL